MTYTKKPNAVMAAIGAISISSLITSEVSALLFGMAYTLPDGTIQKAAFAFSGVASLAFFTWLGLHAYTVEIELMIGNHNSTRGPLLHKPSVR